MKIETSCTSIKCMKNLIQNFQRSLRFANRLLSNLKNQKRVETNDITNNSIIITACGTGAGSGVRLKYPIFDQALQRATAIANASFPVFATGSPS